MNFAIVGLGGRGTVYSHFIRENDRQIVAVCDPDESKRSLAKSFGVPENAFYTDENEFFSRGKIADALVISTLDTLHCRQALRALELGYDIMLEKPIAVTLEDCIKIEKKAKETGRKVVVCHVLRYSPFFSAIKSLLTQKTVGEPVSISLTEEIGFYHYAHSYVRGNWRNEKVSTPLILAKNCHDLDMLCWLLEGNVKTVSSIGGLKYFTKENAPSGAAEFCYRCPHKNDCQFSSFLIYNNADYERLAGLAKHGRLGSTREEIARSLSDETNLYSRCVFHCDNDICDHQLVNILFDKGVTAAFHSTAFSQRMSRYINIYCTDGNIWGSAEGDVYYQKFGESVKEVKIHYENGGYANHSGGDVGIVRQFIDYVERGIVTQSLTDISCSVLSHKIGFFAEESRKNDGKLIRL